MDNYDSEKTQDEEKSFGFELQQNEENTVEADMGNSENSSNSPFSAQIEFEAREEPSPNQENGGEFNGEPVYNKVEFSSVAPIEDYAPASKGLKAFCLVMAVIILLTAASAVGYFAGKSSVSGIGENVKVDLEAKPENTDGYTPAKVYDTVNKSIVGIRIYNTAGSAADASGVIYTSDGYIITNDHIYSEIGAPKFRVYMYDGTEYDASYIAGDSISDLAVIKIDGVSDLNAATLGNSDELICGEEVVAIGRPSDATDNSSITRGVVSLPKRRVKTTSNYTSSLIQTDSAINPGSSGGALVNMYGQTVGITSSKLAGVEYDSIGYAIPTVTVKRVVEQLIKHKKVVDRAKLGITYTEISSVIAEMNNYSDTGLYVASVSEDSDIFGKVVKGDIITHVNGMKITNDNMVLDLIEQSKAGDTIVLTVLSQNGSVKDYKVVLKANIGESSYSSAIKNTPSKDSSGDSSDGSSDGSSGGVFDFPFGE